MIGRRSLPDRLAECTSPAVLPGLERTRALLALLGRPERGLKIVHVAGTNGKGSVCRMLESVFLASGFKTGLYTSPHLVDFNERFRVGGRPASRASLEAAARPLWKALRTVALSSQGPATYFEALTALAFLYFKRQKVELLVLETGMGGRLDSTNVVQRPLLTLITNIALDHTRILGTTEAAIAFEKAGIIKKGSPLVTAVQGRAREVILRRFRLVQGRPGPECVALKPGRDWRTLGYIDTPELQRQKVEIVVRQARYTVDLPLLGVHQHENLACVLAACGVLARPLGLRWARVTAGLANADWPGRLQMISKRPLTLLDGAHNPAGARVLAAYVRDLQGRRAFPRTAFVVGVLKDKDWRRMFRAWMPLAGRFFVATPPDARALPATEAARWLKARGCRVQTAHALPQALRMARHWSGKQGLVMAAGSLYTVGALLKNR